MTIPGQSNTFRNDGVGAVEREQGLVPLFLGCSSAGPINVVQTHRQPSALVDVYNQGPLAEDACAVLKREGGPAKIMRLNPSVAGSISAVAAARVDASTGTVACAIAPQNVGKCLQIDDPAGTPVYVDQTSEAQSSTADDVDPWPASEAIGDQMAVGFHSPFNKLTVTVSATAGVGGTLTYKYWNGTAWTAVSGLTDATTGFTVAGANTVVFTMPTDWAPRSLNGSDDLYYLVAEVAGVYSTNPILNQIVIENQGPYDEFDIIAEVTKTGTLGTAEWRYTLDGGESYTDSIVIPSGGTYSPANTGLKFTFTAGGGPVYFEDGDLFTLTTTPPHFAAADLSAAVTALKAGTESWDFIVLCGGFADASTAATIFAALDTHCQDLENNFRYGTAAMQEFGSRGTAALAKTSLATVESDYVTAVYGRVRVLSAKPLPGWSYPMRATCAPLAWQALRVGLSGDLKRVASGALSGVKDPEHDESKATTTLDDARCSTFRTWPGSAGIYITQGRIKSGVASDFRLWPHRMVANRYLSTIYPIQQTFIGKSPRVNSDASIADGNPGAPGTIYEVDASNYEKQGDRALRSELKAPSNADGVRGHVSDLSYTIDRAYDIATNAKIKTTGKIVSLAYVDFVEGEFSFTLAL